MKKASQMVGICLLALGVTTQSLAQDAASAFQKARELYAKSNVTTAMEALKKTDHKRWTGAQQALKLFAMAAW